MSHKILIVEDSNEYRLILESSLAHEYQIHSVATGQAALESLQASHFDIAIVDIVLPDISGLQICNFIKTQKNLQDLPVILLTSKDSADDKVHGLNSGADDYITKPFDHRELEARIRIQLRKRHRRNSLVNIQNLQIDEDKQRVLSIPEQKYLDLTRIEYKLLICFSHRIDHVLSRRQLLDLVWANDLNVSERTVDSHISNLRKKLAGSGVEIAAVQGCGYRFTILPQAA